MKQIVWIIGLICFAARVFSADLTQWVNPFMGTTVASDNTHPGAQAPFGMISWSPQTTGSGWSPSGYNYRNDRINGLGLTHLSGAGCSATCDLPFMPCTGDLDISPATNRNAYSSISFHTNELASPGYYSVKLSTWNIGFEDTVKDRSGIAHIDFPATQKANVVLNPRADGAGLKDGAIYIDPTNQLISGWAKSGGFGGISGGEHVVYFAAQFDRPFEAIFVQRMQLNGKPNPKSWVTVDELKRGASLNVVMANPPNTSWATAVADAPPSFGPDSTHAR